MNLDKEEHFYHTVDDKAGLRSKRKRLKILLFVSIAVLVFFLGLTVLALNQGGFDKIISDEVMNNGDRDEGTQFDGANEISDEDKELYEKPVELPLVEKDRTEFTKSKKENYIVFDNYIQQYSITIQAGTSVVFTNDTAELLKIQFSDGRGVSLSSGKNEKLFFLERGRVSFMQSNTDASDITGIINVE